MSNSSKTSPLAEMTPQRRELLERRNLGYAIHFVLDCGSTIGGIKGPGDGAEPTDANLALVLQHAVRRPRPEDYAGIRRHVNEYRAAQTQIRRRVLQLAGELSDFGQYPAEENITDGKCFTCGHFVQAHQGMFATGSDNGGIFGVHLHRGCLAEVKQARAALVTA